MLPIQPSLHARHHSEPLSRAHETCMLIVKYVASVRYGRMRGQQKTRRMPQVRIFSIGAARISLTEGITHAPLRWMGSHLHRALRSCSDLLHLPIICLLTIYYWATVSSIQMTAQRRRWSAAIHLHQDQQFSTPSKRMRATQRGAVDTSRSSRFMLSVNNSLYNSYALVWSGQK